MNQRTLAILSAAVVVVIVIVAVVWVKVHPSGALSNASQAPVVAAAKIGAPAPEFQAATTQGAFDLATATKPVFLEVFATWCPHCQRETAVLNRLYAAYGSRVQFVAVSGSDTGMDGTSPSSQLDVLNFAQKFAVKYPIAYDGTLSVSNAYLQGGYPTVAIIDKKHVLHYLNSGEISYTDLAGAIQSVL